MATVKTKFRSSTRQGGLGTLYYQVCHGGHTCCIPAQIYLFPEEWDEQKEQIVLSAENYLRLQPYRQKLQNDMALLEQIMNDLKREGRDYSLSELLSLFQSGNRNPGVLAYMQQLIDDLRNARKLGTARNYERTLNSVSAFLRGRDISFSLLGEDMVMAYNNWLRQRHISRNSSSFYMRILRAVYNKAVKQHLVIQTFPFKNVYTGVDRTRKRAIDEDIIVQLQKLNLDYSPSLSLARDLFVFSYCTRGMSFVDMAYLKKQDIVGNVISYCRHKTGQRIMILIEPCMETILCRYRLKTEHSPYVFPIIKSLDMVQAYQQYQSALGFYNRKLKELAHMVGLGESFSFYAARHTWATVARNHNIPISIISAGLGHNSEKTTQIYLDSLENSLVDQANRSLLSKLNTVSF